MNLRHAAFTLALLASAREASAAATCADKTNKLAVKYLQCIAKAENALLFGKTADLAACATKLDAAFAATRCYYSPPSETRPRADDAEANVLAALQAGTASTPAAKACVVEKNKRAVNGAKCVAKLMTKALKTASKHDVLTDKDLNGYVACQNKIAKAFAKAEATALGACPTTNDAVGIRKLAARAGVNLEAADLTNLYLTGDVDLDYAVLRAATLAGARLVDANLSGADLSYASAASANLEGANLRNANCLAANLTGANLDGATLEGAVINTALFIGASLRGTDLRGAGASAHFGNADLTGADLDGANLTYSTLTGANLTNVDLSGTVLDGIWGVNLAACPSSLPAGWHCVSRNLIGPMPNLTQADLRGADLTGIDLTGGQLDHVDGRGLSACPQTLPPAWACINSNLVGGTAELSGVDLSNVDLTGVALYRADLAGANLAYANLAGITLSEANLTGANLDHANLTGCYAAGANLSGTDLTTATLTHVLATNLVACPTALPAGWRCPNTTIVGPSALAGYADLHNADLSGLDLTGTDFIGANLADANFANAVLNATRFTGADLTGVDLSTVLTMTGVAGANVYVCPAALPAGWACVNKNLVGPTVYLRSASLAGANLAGFNLSDSTLAEVDLSGADLTNADLAHVNTVSLDLTDADLTGVDLTGAVLVFDDLTGAVLDQADLTNVFWLSTVCPDGSDSATNGSSPESCCGHLNGSVVAAGCP